MPYFHCGGPIKNCEWVRICYKKVSKIILRTLTTITII